mgnify:CR=1
IDGASRIVLLMILNRSCDDNLLVARYPQDETTLEAIRVFSRSNTASCLVGSRICLRNLSFREVGGEDDGVVLTRPWVTTVGR